MPSYDSDPFRYLRRRAVGKKFGASESPIAILYLEAGNSHGGGRPSALGTEIWPRNAYQWTQSSTLQQMATSGRYNLDQVAGGSYSTSTTIAPAGWDNTNPPSGTYAQISPALWHSQLIAADYPNALICYVPHNKNATGFVDGSWTAAGAPSNLLGQLVIRANAARAALVAMGYTVIWGGVAFHNADPDYDEGTNWSTHRSNIDGMVDYFRANLTNAPSTMPIVIGSGMTNAQLTGLSSNDVNYQADLAQAGRRRAYVWTMDNINPRPGMTVSGLPLVPMVDGIHENYAGVQVLGQLRYLGYVKAAANTNPRTPWHNLSFASSLVNFHDFRAASRTDFSGSGNTLSNVGTTFPLHTFDSLIGGYILRRAAASTTYRVYQLPNTLTTSYTKSIWFRFDSFATSQDLYGDMTTALGTARHRLAYAQSTDKIIMFHGATNVAEVTGAAALLGTSAFHLITCEYDLATTTAKIFIDGTLMVTNTSAVSVTPSTGGYLAGGDGASTTSNPVTGRYAAAWGANRALTLAEVQELYAACLLSLA